MAKPTPEEIDSVLWWAIDESLKRASSFYESMAKSHIMDLVNEIKAALERNDLEITEKVKETPK
jgi:hypothetical protein